MLRAKLAAFASALILVGTAFANREVCPELSAIQAEGVSMAMEVYGMYATYQLSNFNTDSSWGFIIAPIAANSMVEAIGNANDILRKMTTPGVLLQESLCNYETGNPDVYAIAIQDELLTATKLRQYIRH
ncbi:DUF4949 domain-containing protein [Legionella sp.]|uniref:DUF4949 domain-containing protein n=1 Tax=Legionella sp. TaxID=459 RepID=UPI003CC0BBD0